MYIQQSSVSISQQHQFQRVEQSTVIRQRVLTAPTAERNNLDLSSRPNPVISSQRNNSLGSTTATQGQVEQSPHQALYRKPKPSSAVSNLMDPGAALVQKGMLDHRLQLMKAMIASINGDSLQLADLKMNSNSSKQLDLRMHQFQTAALNINIARPEALNESTSNDVGASSTGLTTETVVVHSTREYEHSSVAINAQLQARDGLHLDIHIHQQMARSYQEQSFEVRVEKVQLQDPLVINFGGDGLQLSAERTRFDLNSDGQLESIAGISSNSAYIALDRNGDGIINNGSELFGASSGDGFAELAMYDEDGNGFIDDGDSVFSQLLAYRPIDNSTQSLKDLNVGALYLKAIDSPFRITDENNQTLAQVRATSFFIMEDGSSNTLQQIDLAV